MGVRFPVRPLRLELGLALDLAWDQDPGVVSDPARGDVVSDDIAASLGRLSSEFTHLSVGWQPRRRSHVEAEDYFAAYDDLFARAGGRFSGCALHHTALSRRV